jgi:hypothetical protein
MGVQARTPLLWKTCGLDPFGHAQSRERVVGSRQQRLADMKSGEFVALKENDRMITLPKRDGSGRAGRTAAGNSEIKVIGCFGHFHRIAKE